MSICGKLEFSLLSPKAGIFVENCSTIYFLAYMEGKKQHNLLGGGKTQGGCHGNHGEIAEGKYKVAKCKTSKEELGRKEGQIAEKWVIQGDFYCFDNSKVLKRQ